MLFSAASQTTNTTYDPELVNTAHSGVELLALWKGKYPELDNSVGAYYFPNLWGFLTGYVMRDQEIQAAQTGRVLAQEIVSINKILDEGYLYIELDVLQGNVKAENLFRKLGFEEA